MKPKITFFTLLLLGQAALAQQKDLVSYVNTLQGTNSKHELTRGNTYPTTALPFGMHTWTPQTGKNGDGWKYQYDKKSIRGFQQAHLCSSWTTDYCVFSFMPVIGRLVVNENDRATGFSHENETARPNCKAKSIVTITYAMVISLKAVLYISIWVAGWLRIVEWQMLIDHFHLQNK